MGVKLTFPITDSRSNGSPFNTNRPWLFQGARGRILPFAVPMTAKGYEKRFLVSANVVVVIFDGSKRGDYDLVASEFLKQVQD